MRTQNGFSLIELAIVLVIVTILIGGLAVPLSAQIEARRIGETRKTLEEAREAIIGYAMTHATISATCTCTYTVPGSSPCLGVLDTTPPDKCPISRCTAPEFPVCPTAAVSLNLTLPKYHYLPCPDLNGTDPEPAVDNDGVDDKTDINNGVEDRYKSGINEGKCMTSSGNLPWVTLATAAQDAWGNRLHYSLTNDPDDPLDPVDTYGLYGNSTTGFSNADKGDKQICSTSTGGCPSGTVARNVPVVIVSYGPNGWAALNINGTTLAAPTSADELENADADNSYVSRFPSKIDAAAGEFDDLLVWISKDLLISRVCQGGCP